MKFLVALLSIAVIAYAQNKYDSTLDDFNLTEVLENERLLIAYSKCLLDKGPCTPEVKKLKETLPDALKTKCAKCTDKQKHLGKQVVRVLQVKYPIIWAELVDFYDPERKYKEDFHEFLKS